MRAASAAKAQAPGVGPRRRVRNMNQRTDTKGATVKVTLIKSPIGFKNNQAAVVRGLGLRRIRHTVELKDTPSTRGMIHKVRHLVEVE
jgi:large subunit ribosomal protein L30